MVKIVLLTSIQEDWLEYKVCFFTFVIFEAIFPIGLLKEFGDWIEGTKIVHHHSSRHLIVVNSTLTEDLIEKTLRSIENEGSIIEATIEI